MEYVLARRGAVWSAGALVGCQDGILKGESVGNELKGRSSKEERTQVITNSGYDFLACNSLSIYYHLHLPPVGAFETRPGEVKNWIQHPKSAGFSEDLRVL